jgi:hypothetical protein
MECEKSGGQMGEQWHQASREPCHQLRGLSFLATGWLHNTKSSLVSYHVLNVHASTEDKGNFYKGLEHAFDKFHKKIRKLY